VKRSSLPVPQWGNLRRSRPFSEGYGFDRGTPVDRVFIERFLSGHADQIHGDVLEVKDPTYSLRFGTDVRPHVLDIDKANVEATVIADLSEPDSLPPEIFDCFILTQTLQYVADPQVAVRNAYRALVPGGILLCSVPTTSRVDSAEDRWRMTPTGLGDLLIGEFDSVGVVGYGNLTTQIAFLLGLAAEELEPRDFEDDPDFPLIACGSAMR